MGLADVNSGPFVNFMVHFARSFPFPVFPTGFNPTPSFFTIRISLFFITRYSPFMNVTAYRVCVALCLFHNGHRYYGFAIVDDHRPPYNFSSFYLLRSRFRSPFRHFFPFNTSRQPCIFTPVLAMYALKIRIETS